MRENDYDARRGQPAQQQRVSSDKKEIFCKPGEKCGKREREGEKRKNGRTAGRKFSRKLTRKKPDLFQLKVPNLLYQQQPAVVEKDEVKKKSPLLLRSSERLSKFPECSFSRSRRAFLPPLHTTDRHLPPKMASRLLIKLQSKFKSPFFLPSKIHILQV